MLSRIVCGSSRRVEVTGRSADGAGETHLAIAPSVDGSGLVVFTCRLDSRMRWEMVQVLEDLDAGVTSPSVFVEIARRWGADLDRCITAGPNEWVWELL